MNAPSVPPSSPAFSRYGYRSYLYMRFATELAVQMQTVAIGWTVYDRTENPLYLGLIGLTQFAPALVLVLFTGAIADAFPRNKVVAWCMGIMALSAGGLCIFILVPELGIWPVFVFMTVFGAARAFYQPAQQSLIVNLVPAKTLANAIAFNSATTKIATICGPVLGGILYQWLDYSALVAASVAFVSGMIVSRFMRYRVERMPNSQRGWSALVSGFNYVRGNKVLFGAISLDMMAVLLGGMLALMPVFARDVLDVGPAAFGLLYASPALGGVLMALMTGLWPIKANTGRILFAVVAIFGLSVIVFSVSTSLTLSLAALFVMGGADMVSVNIRHTLVQVRTPETLRGRVSAINSVSVGASNEIGQFRGGVIASLIGAVPTGVVAGASTLLVVVIWRFVFPDLYRVRTLNDD